MLKSFVQKLGCGLSVSYLLFGITAVTSAAPVTINNHSFETPLVDPQTAVAPNGTPIDGWETTSWSEMGVWDPGMNSYNLLSPPAHAPDGNQIAFVGYLFPDMYLTQVLSVDVQPNTLYTLTAQAAGLIGLTTPYTISLRAGDNELASITDEGPEGSFKLITVSFNSTGSSSVGLPLEVRLLSFGQQTAFDDIRLDASPAPTLHPGDFDSDGDVDGADFVAWQTNFPTASGATLAQGDADADGDVDGADFVVWQTNFPFTPGPGTSPVPEPSALLLMVGAAAALIAKRMVKRN